MIAWLRNPRSALLSLAPFVLAAPLSAQTLALKTVPIATGEQFLIFPSRSLGMAGLSIAYDDALQDGFGNPARGAGVQGTWFMALPTFYDSNLQSVGGSTLPLALVRGGEKWFGAAAVAVQQLEAPEQQGWWWWNSMPESTRLLVDDEATNTYLFGSLGRKLDDGRTSVGVAAYHADLSAIDGVGQLYANSASIQQSGSISDLRAGALRRLDGERTVEAMVGRSAVEMEHDVVYITGNPWVDPVNPGPAIWSTRVEHNVDRTITWGGMMRYTAPLEENSRWGATLVANTKSHPKIPNYDVVNIPRDPGNSAVFAAGLGMTAIEGRSTFGAELMLQPGRSHTWAFADTVTATPDGNLQKGDKTIDNRFEFMNWSVGLGWEHEWQTASVQAGLRLNRYGYRLEQKNYLQAVERETDEEWLEWSPSWGGMVKAGRAELRYTGRFVAKGLEMGTMFGGVAMEDSAPMAPGGNDFLVAPTSPVDMPDFRVTVHRFSVVVPLSRSR